MMGKLILNSLLNTFLVMAAMFVYTIV